MASSQMSDTMQPDIELQSGTEIRARTMTEKGKEYQISQGESKFKSTLSAWRRNANVLRILLTDSEDLQAIRQERDLLQLSLDSLSLALQGLEKIKGNCNWEFLKLDSVESEHQTLMQETVCRLRELEMQKTVVKLLASRSSRCTSLSKTSSTSKVSDAAAKKASLQAKLKYIDLESKYKADLEKIKTLRQLEMAQAELNVYEKDVDKNTDISLPEIDKKDLVEEFISAHASIPVSESVVTKSSFTAQPIYVSASTGQVPFSVTDKPNVVSSVFPVTCNIGQTTVTPVNPASTAQMSVIDTSRSILNPQINAFVPRDVSDQFANQSSSPVFSGSNSADANNPAVTAKVQDVSELTKALVDQVNLSRLPSPEPGVFSGDPLAYPAWKSAFQTLIEQRKIPPSERIHYLKRYISGPVKEVIDGFFLLSSDEAFVEAKKLLDSRFGDKFVLANAFRDKLGKWPKLQPKDSKGLQKFSDFLNQCEVATHSISSLTILNDDRENKRLLTKLPDWVVNRWNRVVFQWKEDKGLFPPFKVFTEFLTKEARIACDPVTSLQSVKLDGSSSEKRVSSHFKFDKSQTGRVLAATGEECSETNDACPLCSKKHDLDNCKAFLAKSLTDRKHFISEKGLCFGCLRSGHISKRCRSRKRCKICLKYHPSSLHGDVRKPKQGSQNSNEKVTQNAYQKPKDQDVSKNLAVTQEVPKKDLASHSFTSFSSESATCCKTSMVVPVVVSHKDNPDHEIMVYAMLDTQSDSTFILESTCHALGLPGVDVKLSLSTMHAENLVVDCKKVRGLEVRGFESQSKISLPDVYTRDIIPANRAHIPTPEIARSLPNLEFVADHLLPLQNCEVGLLIGYNCPKALMPRDVVTSTDEGPFAQRTDLGWGLVGILNHGQGSRESLTSVGWCHRTSTFELSKPVAVNAKGHVVSSVQFCSRTKTKEVFDPAKVLRVLESDFIEQKHANPISREDEKFISTMKEKVRIMDGKYTMPLPFREDKPELPNNRSMALQRFEGLRKRLSRDPEYREKYFSFMNSLIEKGHATKVPEDEIPGCRGSTWYIPHHGVHHPHKPGKLRVVYDCSAKFRGTSLNDHLLSGPDLTNLLVGVLCRFRQEAVAFSCDIEQMFYQFKVEPKDRDFLRFLWFDGTDIEKDPVDYRMTVHLFGATSSPGCANFGLKRIASDFALKYGQDVCDFVQNDFYVDDGLKSLPNNTEAVDLISKTQKMLSEAGVRLCKFTSNSAVVLNHLKPEDRAGNPAKASLKCDKLSVDRALGVQWCIQSDTLQFRIVLNDRPLTRRGILSVIGSVYDPLGLISPVILQGKQILQTMCASNADWDDLLPQSLQEFWFKWCSDIQTIENVKVERCFKPACFEKIATAEVHHFSDASSQGYGHCSYLRLMDQGGKIHCSLLMGKSRVVPLKPVTIPRLELCAAVVSVKVGILLDKELQYSDLRHFYYTDSNIVLGYINNDAKRFHVFVANRVGLIRENSKPCQWQHVKTEQNPADGASRGVTVSKLVSSNWFTGPNFLWESREQHAEPTADQFPVPADDPEVKKGHVFSTTITEKMDSTDNILERLEYFSDWNRAKHAIALILRLREKLKDKVAKRQRSDPSSEQLHDVNIPVRERLTVEELERAEVEIIKLAQRRFYSKELELLKKSSKEKDKNKRNLTKRSTLYRLNPVLGTDGLIRVGGRLTKSDIDGRLVHPIVLPRKGHITDLLIRHCHSQVRHQGRGMTVNQIRSSGYWIIGCSSSVSFSISRCVICRKLRGFRQTQKMSDLPIDRVDATPPFTYVGVDYFGPWYIKEGRKELKRYGVIFTCLCCRAIHLETAISLDTSSFINALRRFIAVRGPIRQLRSDRGTNFIGAERELREAVSELDETRIAQFLLNQNCDSFHFKTNVPSASHMGGVWERQIRTVRNVLSSLLHQSGAQLDDESLRTFICEVAAIVNSRPLAVENLNDPLSAVPLTPNHLLTMKTQVVLPPPGEFSKPDMYCRRRWRRVQYLANQFWYRWRREYLQILQQRNKWVVPKRNICIGDVVLVVDENLPRSQWRLARVNDTTIDDDGLVRRVKLATSGSEGFLERPIHKLVLVLEAN